MTQIPGACREACGAARMTQPVHEGPINGLEDEVLAAVLQQAPVGVVVADAPSGRVVFVNAEAERIWGRPVELGENIWTYRVGEVLRSDGAHYRLGELPLARSIRDGEVIKDERVLFRGVDGVRRQLCVSSAPVRNERGEITAGVVAYTDVTKRVVVEERSQSLIDSVEGIVWELDVASFQFTFVSQQATRLLGYPIEDWYQPNFWVDILHPQDRQWALEFCLDRTKRQQPHDFEYRVRACDGRVVWLRDIVTVLSENDAPKTLRGIMVDITASRHLEAERERLLVLERAAREQAEFHAREARDAIRLRDEFLSIASHELKTPLHSLQLLVQGVIQRGSTLSPAALQQSLPLAARQVKRLTRLVSMLLDVSRIQLGHVTLHREEVDLTGVVQDIAAQFAEEAARARSAITIRGAAHVRGRWDRARIEQVVVNLLSNAIKFGAGGPIDVLVEQDHDRARLVVRDHGIGVAPERLPHIFNRFERGVSARSYGGLGLGLFLVASIVGAHEGSVNAESTLGAGSCFTVELPCNP
jgi:PAS domain S-box-containing protein